uniref:Transmembrane protein n=1 Tax=Solanum tuberosum TaxID=4113 RepID=M1DEI4_SOLTU
MANENAINFTNSPSSSPSPSIRKIGKHNQEEEKGINNNNIIIPKEVLIGSPHQQESINEVDQGDHDDEIMINKHHHDSIDKSIYGGGVILGGLATTFFVAIFCYIRVTRRKNNVEPSSPSTTSSEV